MQTDQRLSDHFALSEFTISQAAARAGLRNEPLSSHIENLRRLAQVLEQVRTLLGNRPILISSGYRSPAVNGLVGGSLSSAHTQGLAADFTCPGFGTPLNVCQAIADSGIPFEQLIYEGTWVHVAVATAGATPRRELLTAVFVPGAATRYQKGLMA
jgi:zinc D-Ala-D-Ala carboxypeptidase